jgi:hypothetical protein
LASAGALRPTRSCQNSQLWTRGYIFRRRVERAATIALPLAGASAAEASGSVIEGRLFCAIMTVGWELVSRWRSMEVVGGGVWMDVVGEGEELSRQV